MIPSRRLALFAAAAALLLATDLPVRATNARARASIPGLAAPVTILTDTNGIPHVLAASLPDLYAAWGYVTARDRLWQLSWTRASARGQAHRWLGNTQLQADGGAQLFRLAERAAAIWARDRADPTLRVAIQRYTDGINARMDECRRGEAPWSPELVRLHAKPAPWRCEDTVLLLLAMGITLDLDLPELRESESQRKLGAKATALRHRFEGRWIFDTIPDSAAHAPAPAPAPAPPTTATRAPARGGPARLSASTLAAAQGVIRQFAVHADDGSDRASNEMVVGAGRSASGMPLLANDPHLSLTTPGALHVVHLSVPGVVEAIGAAIPGLPVIASGRNRTCAWGLTALSADVVDVYADTLSADGRRARSAHGWERVVELPYDLHYRVLGVAIPIPPPFQVRRYTSHGPVLVWDPKHHVALAARWSALEDGRITLARLIGLERASSAEEIAERCRTLVTPTLNIVAADRGAHAIYQTVGLLPVRTGAFERGVLPGDGRHEWTGFVPAAQMPAWHLGPRDFAVNGNNRPGGSGRDWQRFDWVHDRAARMAQRLAGDASVTRADLASIQNDVISRSAQRTSPVLLTLAGSPRLSPGARERAALDTLRAWDFGMRRSRIAPTLNRAWWNAYLRRSQFEGLPGLGLAALTGEAQDALRTPAGAPETSEAAALAALVMALDTLSAKLGPDLATWTWGRAHRARFSHALAALSAADRARFEPPYTPEDGDGSTPSVGGTRAPWNFDVRHGPVFRHVVDLADTVTSLGVVPPWNNELHRGAGMRERWAHHDYVRFTLDRDQIRADAVESLVLEGATPRR